MMWLLRWWRRRQHAMDVAILWPTCLEEGRTREKAKMLFYVHMCMDPSYSHMTEDDKHHFIEALP
jgi:hypothetical protein